MTGGELVVTGGPVGGVPVPVATLVTPVASRSAWVTVWVAEQVIEALGARVATGRAGLQLVMVASASVTLTAVRVTFRCWWR